MKIRPYKPGDYPAVLAIYAASKLDELRCEKARFTLLPLEKDPKRLGLLLESEIYICEEDGIVGYGAKHGAEIRALFVHPESRGKGFGRGLLELLLAGIPGPANLYVARSNSQAKNLYMQYGFEVVEEFETSYNGIPVFANKMIRPGEKS